MSEFCSRSNPKCAANSELWYPGHCIPTSEFFMPGNRSEGIFSPAGRINWKREPANATGLGSWGGNHASTKGFKLTEDLLHSRACRGRRLPFGAGHAFPAKGPLGCLDDCKRGLKRCR
jgi:hypothetical protein